MSRRGLLGFVVAACLGCAGPLLAAVGGIAALGAIGTVAFGAVALAVAGVAISVLVVVRRRLRVPARPEPQRVGLGTTQR